MTVIRRTRCAILALGAWLCAATGALAQGTPQTDPGFLLRPIERERERLEEQRPAAPVPEDPVAVPTEEDTGVRIDGGPTFRLEGVRFNQSGFLDPTELAETVREFVGREIDFRGLDRIVERINALYRERGLYTARAIVPPQHIRDGIVEIRLVEGRLGKAEISGNVYTSEPYLRSRIPMTPGELVDLPRLREQLDWFNNTGDLRARASLRAGEGFGESDVVIVVEEPSRHRLQVYLDNHGVESTGEYQLGAYYVFSGLAGRDDRLSLFVVASRGARTVRADYGAVINARGGRLSGALYKGDIKLVDGPFKDLKVTGESTGWQLQYDHPWVRREHWRLDSLIRLSQGNSTSDISGVTVSDTDIGRTVIGIRGRYAGLGGTWGLEQNVSMGRSKTILGDSQSYVTYPGALTHMRPGARAGHVWAATFGWQFTGEDTLPPPDLFQLGGLGTVRGYPASVVAGVRGYFLNLEYHWQLSDRYQPFVFLDHGTVYGESPKEETISSVGFGVHARFGPSWRGEAIFSAASRKVTPDQDKARLDLRLVYDFGG